MINAELNLCARHWKWFTQVTLIPATAILDDWKELSSELRGFVQVLIWLNATICVEGSILPYALFLLLGLLWRQCKMTKLKLHISCVTLYSQMMICLFIRILHLELICSITTTKTGVSTNNSGRIDCLGIFGGLLIPRFWPVCTLGNIWLPSLDANTPFYKSVNGAKEKLIDL